MRKSLLIASLAFGGLSAAALDKRQAAGSVPLGGSCSDDSQCANGAMCYASNGNSLRLCGNFNAACASDSECAFGPCINGSCGGTAPTTSRPGTTTTTTTATTTTTSSASVIPTSFPSSVPTLSISDTTTSTLTDTTTSVPSSVTTLSFSSTSTLSSLSTTTVSLPGTTTASPQGTTTQSSLGTTTASLQGTATSSPSGAATSATSTNTPPRALGAECDNSSQCSNGVDCYASNSMLIKRCGNFNAACTTDSQCAYNTCNNGLCNGFKPTVTSPSGITTTATSSSSGTTTSATAISNSHSRGLGEACDDDSQCGEGVQCWASNAMLIKRCGNFNAACSGDSQCAFNTCNNGLCNGFRATASGTTTVTTTPTPTRAPPRALGANCDDSSQCGDGVQCWASNAMLMKRCGNFNAACSGDSQCAYNTCNNGLCNGFKPAAQSTTSASAATTTTTTSAPPRALGADCTADSQCAAGVQCHYQTFPGSQQPPSRVCGNFNATCAADSQCAANTCDKGRCTGYRSSPAASGGRLASTLTLTLSCSSTAATAVNVAVPSGTATAIGGGVRANGAVNTTIPTTTQTQTTPSPSSTRPPQNTNAAATSYAFSGVGVAVAAIAFAFAL